MLILKDYSAEDQLRDFDAWYRKHRPDAILDHYNRISFTHEGTGHHL